MLGSLITTPAYFSISNITSFCWLSLISKSTDPEDGRAATRLDACSVKTVTPLELPAKVLGVSPNAI